MKSYLGEYRRIAGETVEATVLIFHNEIHIGYVDHTGQAHRYVWSILDVHVDAGFPTQETRLSYSLEKNSTVFIPGKAAADYIKSMQAEQVKPWYKKSRAKEWGRNLLLLLGIVASLVIVYLLIVPWMAEKMASTVSPKTEAQFGETVYSALALEQKKDSTASVLVNRFFQQMQVPSVYAVQISVVRGDEVNAFALPGGRIVVYTALLSRIKSYPELAALLSHEFMHVANRHSTRSIFRKLGSRIFISLLFGRVGAVGSVLADHADNLKSLTYSRSLEKEADLEGLHLLQQRNIDPRGFVDLLQHLKSASGGSVMPEFLASHPDIDKRIRYIQEATTTAAIENNDTLNTIFNQLKQLPE